MALGALKAVVITGKDIGFTSGISCLFDADIGTNSYKVW